MIGHWIVSYESSDSQLVGRDERTQTRIERTLVFVRVRPNMNEHEDGFFQKLLNTNEHELGKS